MSLRTRAWHVVRHDIGRKLTALGLALGVWFVLEGMVLDEQNEVLDVIEVHSVAEADADRLTANRSTVYLVVPEALQVQGVKPQMLRLRVKGLKEDVRGLVMSAVIEFDEADLSGADEAAVTRTLGRENFKGRDRSPELTLFRLNNDASTQLAVTLVRRTSLTMELKATNVVVTGLPAKGYTVDTVAAGLRPNSVTVSGPLPIVDRFKTEPGLLKLAPVSVENRNGRVTQTVGLSQALLDQKVSLEPKDVDVTLNVSPMDKDVVLVAIPITFENEDALLELGFTLAERPPDKIDVKVRGPAPELDTLTTEQLARNIRLVFDYKRAPLLNGRSKYFVEYFLRDLSLAVKVLGADDRAEAPKIEFKLDEIRKGP